MKIPINLDFDAILQRIEQEKEGIKPGEWAKRIGVRPNIVSNVHGKIRQKPSLEYIVAVSMATGRSVDYYLFGEASTDSIFYIPAHSGMIECFKQKDLALEINWNALKLEGIKSEALTEVNDFIQFKIGSYDRRQGERRMRDARDQIPGGGDRRAGMDRRRASGGN